MNKFSRYGIVFVLIFSYSRIGSGSERFPDEFLALAKKLGCKPLTDKPYYWGALIDTKEKKLNTKDSGVFWCKTKKDEEFGRLFGSIAIFIRGDSRKTFSCPLLIERQQIGEEFEIWKPGLRGKPHQDLSNYYYLDTDKAGKKGPLDGGGVIENIYARDTVGAIFYCHKGRWLKNSYE